MKEHLTVSEAARRKGCTVKYVYDLLWSGLLPGARKVGRSWRIPPAGIDARRHPKYNAVQAKHEGKTP